MGIERSATGSRLLRSDRDCPRLTGKTEVIPGKSWRPTAQNVVFRSPQRPFRHLSPNALLFDLTARRVVGELELAAGISADDGGSV